MNKPTEEEIKRFWWWVFDNKVEFHSTADGKLCIYRITGWDEEYKENKLEFLGYGSETLNLNDLFKYAVPKLSDMNRHIILRSHVYTANLAEHPEYEVSIGINYPIKAHSLDPAIALFWSAYKTMEVLEG